MPSVEEFALATEYPADDTQTPATTTETVSYENFMGASPARPRNPIEDMPPAFQSFISGLARFHAGLAKLPAAIYDIAAIPQNAVERMTGWRVGTKAPEWLVENPLARYYDRVSEAYNYRQRMYAGQDLVSLMQSGRYQEAGDYLLQSVIENTPTGLTAVGGALAGVPEAQLLALLGAQQGAQTHAQARTKNLGALEAASAAVANGSLEAVWEHAGTFGLLKWGEDLFKDVGPQAGKAIMKKTLKLVAGSFIGEGNEEFWTQLTQDFTNKVYGVENIPWRDFPRRAIEAGAIGAISGATMTAPGGAMQGLRISQAQTDQARANAIIERLKTTAPLYPEPIMAQTSRAGTVGERVSAQLTALGTFTPEQVSAYARIYESAFTALGKRAGIEPLELFGRYRLRIGTETGAGGVVLEQGQQDVMYHGTSVAGYGTILREGFKSGRELKSGEERHLISVAPIGVAKAYHRSGLGGEGRQIPLSIRGLRLYEIAPYSNEHDEITRTGKIPKGYDGVKVVYDRASKEDKIRKGDIYEILIPAEVATQRMRALAGGTVLEQAQPMAPVFYSRLIRTIEEKMPASAPADQVRGIVKEMKEEERAWLGLEEFLRGKERVGKAELLAHLEANQVQVKEVERGGGKSFEAWVEEDLATSGNMALIQRIYPELEDPEGLTQVELVDYIMEHPSKAREYHRETEFGGGTKFHAYQLPGGANYRELLVTVPAETAEAFRSPHFDEPNVLAHVRFNDRTDAQGKKVLFIEEVQSDWHQAGRRRGYGQKAAGVPDAPFKKTWHELVLKRMLRYAAEGGYDVLAWTTGEQQAARYDLSKQVSELRYDASAEKLYIFPRGQVVAETQSVTPEKLPDVIGKEIAARLLNAAVNNNGMRVLEGVDLKVGGEGMKAFYDEIIPSFLNKFGKRFGAKVGETTIRIGLQGEERGVTLDVARDAFRRGERVETFAGSAWIKATEHDLVEGERFRLMSPESDASVRALDLTPDLKRSALREGFALFQSGEEGPRGRLRFGADRTFNIELLKTADLSTFLHESGHFYLEVLSDLAQAETATEELKADERTLRAWLGAKEGAPWTVAQQEQFARGFEAYLREGRAPTAELAGAFARFKAWLVEIYRSVKDLGVELTDEVRGVMDRLLVAPEQAVDTTFEFGENVQRAIEETATQLPQAEQEAAALEVEAELLKERLAFRKRVGKVKRYAGDYLKEELSAIPRHYFTKAEDASTMDERAQELGYESDLALRDAIVAFESYKPGAEKNLADIMKTLRAIQSAESKARTATRQASRRLFDRLEHVLGRRMPAAKEIIRRAREQALGGGPGSEALYAKLVKGEALSEAEREDFPGLAELEGRLGPILTRIREAPELAQLPPEQLEVLLRDILGKVTAAATSQDDYTKNRTIQMRLKGAEAGREFLESVGDLVDYAFVFSGTRLADINEGLKHQLRRFDFEVNTGTTKDLQRVVPLLEKLNGITREAFADLDFALKNRDEAKVNALIAQHTLGAEFQAVRELLDEIYQRAKDVKLDFGYLEAYWPRRVKDAQGFMDYLRRTEHWSAIAEAIALKEAELGTTMDTEDRAAFVNSLLKGSESDQIKLSLPANVKNRLLDRLTPEMNRFYHSSSAAIIHYVTAMHNAIEQRRLFGADAQTLDASIGAYVDRLVSNGEIEASQEKTVRDILKARFEQRGTSGAVSVYKNLAYIYTMGSPISAITQITDLAFSMYRNGIFPTLAVAGKAATGRTTVTMEDLGIDLVGVEFTEGSGTLSKQLRQVFAAIGLKFTDAFGKLTLAEAGFNRLVAEARAESVPLRARLQDIFGAAAETVMEDLKAGRSTHNVKYLLFSEVADFQPVSTSDMPEGYLRAGNWRILYMLKTYSLKLLDVYRNESLRHIAAGRVALGMGNLTRLTVYLMLMGMTADEIKDWLLGRTKELSTLVADNLLKLAGFTKWQIYKSRQEGLGTAFMQSILPPMTFFDDVFRDIVGQRDLPDWRTWSAVPLVGKFYYWWLGGGSIRR